MQRCMEKEEDGAVIYVLNVAANKFNLGAASRGCRSQV